jgi:hypothetical protein
VRKNDDPDRLAVWIDAALVCGALSASVGVVMAAFIFR